MTEKKTDCITTEEVEEGLDMFWEGKPRELPSVISGFTPAPDILIQKYGYVPALVWGRVWRYTQGSDGICRAKLSTIAGELGMSVRNVIRELDLLCEGGYLKDTTPELRNKPHIYADTGKIRIRISVEATMTQSHSRVTQSHSHSDSESLEESIKKEVKDLNINKTALEVFRRSLGKFLSSKELVRWNDLYEAEGRDKAIELVEWAYKKEIHLDNRPGLLDSLETAAKKWRGKSSDSEKRQLQATPKRSLPSFDENGRVIYAH
jgi:hypothetical protein